MHCGLRGKYSGAKCPPAPAQEIMSSVWAGTSEGVAAACCAIAWCFRVSEMQSRGGVRWWDNSRTSESVQNSGNSDILLRQGEGNQRRANRVYGQGWGHSGGGRGSLPSLGDTVYSVKIERQKYEKAENNELLQAYDRNSKRVIREWAGRNPRKAQNIERNL